MAPPNLVPNPDSDQQQFITQPPATTEEDDENHQLKHLDAESTPLTTPDTNGTLVTTIKSPSCNGTTVDDRGDDDDDDDDDDDNESAEAEVVVPPDGGWGWVIVAASFLCNLIVDGIISSFGMFLPAIVDSFQVTKAEVALMGSLMSGFYLMVGPFASALANRYGFRLVGISGAIVGTVAFLISYFATSVPYLYLTYGVIGGIGFGLIYVPAVITVGFYFEKYRALATGIGVCGSGIGTFLFAPLCEYLVLNLGWRKALLVQGAIVLLCAVFGTLYRPLKPIKVSDLTLKERTKVGSAELPKATRQKMEYALKQMEANAQSVHHSQSTIPRIMGANNNADYPTVADVYRTISGTHEMKPLKSEKGEKRLSVPFIPEGERPKDPLLHNKGSTPQIVPSSQRRQSNPSYRNRALSESSQNRSRRGTLTNADASNVNRPLYRDDIFFGASLNRLPQYQSQSSVAYNLAVTRMPTKADIEEETKTTKCTLCPEAMRRTLATMLDISLMKSPTFILLAISGAFTMMGFYVPFMYMADRASDSGMDREKAVLLVAVLGIANTIGRVFCGMLSFMPKINTLVVNNTALTICGIATFLSGLSMTQEFQFTYSVVFGLSISCFASLRSIIVVELLGLEKLTNAFGLLLLFQGIAAAIGAPTAGAFMDATGSYDASFYLSGSFILLSAIMCYPVNYINKWERKRALKKPIAA